MRKIITAGVLAVGAMPAAGCRGHGRHVRDAGLNAHLDPERGADDR
jgi:hypothetical protein